MTSRMRPQFWKSARLESSRRSIYDPTLVNNTSRSYVVIKPMDWSGSISTSGGAGWGTTTNWDVKPGDEVFDTYNKEKNYVLCRGVGLITFGFVDLSHDATDCSWLIYYLYIKM